jgi:hypothetical protein
MGRRDRTRTWYLEIDLAKREAMMDFLIKQGISFQDEAEKHYNGKLVNVLMISPRAVEKLETILVSGDGKTDFSLRAFFQEGQGALCLWKLGRRRNRQAIEGKEFAASA